MSEKEEIDKVIARLERQAALFLIIALLFFLVGVGACGMRIEAARGKIGKLKVYGEQYDSLDNMCGTYASDPLIRPDIRDLYNIIEIRQKKLHEALIAKE